MNRRVCSQFGVLVLVLPADVFHTGCASSKKPVPDQRSLWEMASDYSAQTSGEALLVWKVDTWIVGDYRNAFGPEKRPPLVDGSELHWVLAALAAVDDGLLSLDEPVSETLSAWTRDSAKARITVAQLLRGTSGLQTALRAVPSRDLVVRFGRSDASWNDAEFLARLFDGRRYDVVSDTTR